jgi:hypothetical protein
MHSPLTQDGAGASRAHDLFNSIAGPSTVGAPAEWEGIYGAQVRSRSLLSDVELITGTAGFDVARKSHSPFFVAY